MIPKIIHYCWFGGNPLPDEAKRCIQSWKKFLPDYEIKEWNESNFDMDSCTYVREAYAAKKWAFVSDYARLWILYNFGGLYFDTDVELIKDISDIAEKGAFMGSEPFGSNRCRVNPGLGLGAVSGMEIYREVLHYYDNLKFKISDGVYNDETIVTYITNILKEYGYKGNCRIEDICGLSIFPPEYFCPMDESTGEIYISSNTRSIHWYSASWKNPYEIKIHTYAIRIYRFMPNKLGKLISSAYENIAKVFYYFQKEGVRSVIRRIKRKIRKTT